MIKVPSLNATLEYSIQTKDAKVTIIFVLGADEYIERLEGKIRECLFFYGKIFCAGSSNEC